MTVVWKNVRDHHFGFYRAEDGYLGPCKAEIRFRYPAPVEETLEVTMKITIPGKKPVFKLLPYRSLPGAIRRFDDWKREATDYLVKNCPTH